MYRNIHSEHYVLLLTEVRKIIPVVSVISKYIVSLYACMLQKNNVMKHLSSWNQLAEISLQLKKKEKKINLISAQVLVFSSLHC